MKAIIILIFGWCVDLPVLPAVAAEEDYLTYEKFIAEVESGSIRSATLDKFSRISGIYAVDGAERPFHSFGDVGSANDLLLTRLLKQKNVVVTLKEQKEPSFFGGAGMFTALLMFVTPMVTLILAFRINSKLNRLSK